MQEQEPSVNDILTSIRQILSDKMGEEGTEENTDKKDIFQLEKELTGETEPVMAPRPDLSAASDVFYLTDDMRVQEAAVQMSEPQSRPQNIAPVSEQDVQPMVQAWLEENLRPIVERIVTEEVRRIFNKH